VGFKEASFVGRDSIPANTPAHSGAVAVSYSSVDGVRARVGLTIVDSYNFEQGTWSGEVPSRQTIDVDLGYQLSDQFRVSVSATDVLDQKRFHHFGGSVIGRRLLASLTWEP
jgi:outer membrane receptor protein involved in Fe transport